MYWDMKYRPSFRARILYTMLRIKLGYHVLSYTVYQYMPAVPILGPNFPACQNCVTSGQANVKSLEIVYLVVPVINSLVIKQTIMLALSKPEPPVPFCSRFNFSPAYSNSYSSTLPRISLSPLHLNHRIAHCFCNGLAARCLGGPRSQ